MRQAEKATWGMSGRENCACSQASIPVKDAQMERVCDTYNPRVLQLHHNPQHPDLSHWELVSQALQLLRSPTAELLFPELFSQIYSSPSPPPSFLSIFPKTFSCLPQSLPYPAHLSPSLLLSHISHSPLPQTPSRLALYPPIMPFHFNFFTLYGSIYSQTDSPLATSPAGVPAVLLMLT